MMVAVRPVAYSTDLFSEIIAEASSGDGTFLDGLRERWCDGSERFDRPGELLLGAFVGATLVGIAGLSHDPYEPTNGLARVRHVYVLVSYRKRGIARLLLGQLIEHASTNFTTVRLKTSNPAAASLYEDLGFIPSTQERETHRLRFQMSSTSRP